MGSYAYRKVDIEGVGCFTVPKPVWDLLQDIDTIRADAIAERDAARAERDALRDDNIRTAGILGAVMRERDKLRAIAQAALDNGGDRELVYAPLYQQALEDIASEEQDDNSIHVAP